MIFFYLVFGLWFLVAALAATAWLVARFKGALPDFPHRDFGDTLILAGIILATTVLWPLTVLAGVAYLVKYLVWA